jgi:hypothetical protein
MVFSKVKLAFIICSLGVSGNQAAKLFDMNENQPAVWEITNHPDYETILTVRHRYTGDYADPIDVYIQTNDEGDAVSFSWSNHVASVPEELVLQETVWKCGRNDRGLITLSNVFTGEAIPHDDLRLIQPLLSETILCYATHKDDGFIRASFK